MRLTSEALFSTCQATFERLAPDSGIRLKMSACRDLFSRAAYGIAHSQAMVRCRVGQLGELLLDHAAVNKAASVFEIVPASLLDLVIRSIPTLCKVRDAASSWYERSDAIVAVVGFPGPRRSSALAAVTSSLIADHGDRHVHRALRNCPNSAGYPDPRLRETVVCRSTGVAFAPELRNCMTGMSRMDADTLTFDSVDSPAIAKVASEAVHWGSRLAIAADSIEFVEVMIGSTWRRPHARKFDTRVLVVDVDQDYSATEFRRRERTEPSTVYTSVVAHGVHLATKLATRRGLLRLSELADDDWRRAMLVVDDTLGRIQNRDLAHRQLVEALSHEGVEDTNAYDVAERVLKLIP